VYLWERGEGRANRSGGGGAEDFPKWGSRSYPKVGLSADFWLARGIDDVTVQKSADSVAPYVHTLYY